MATCVDVTLAQQTSVVHFPALLSDVELNKVKACHRQQLDSGVSRTQYPHKHRTFLNGGGAAGGGLPGSAPALVSKLLSAAASAKERGAWIRVVGDALQDIDVAQLKIRVVEFWEYEPGGGLVDDYHYDLGSIITIVCLVDKDVNLSGGVFRTFEADGTHAEHMLERGDVLCLLSHKYHNVTPVIVGYRHSLVLELWEDTYNENCARMASDQDSGFVGCGSAAAARQAVCDLLQDSIELTAIKSHDDIAACLSLVDDLLGKEHPDPWICGLSFASCSLNSDDFGRLSSALQTDFGRELTSFGISKNTSVDRGAWHNILARVPEKIVWLDFGDNQLSDADAAPLFDSLHQFHTLGKLYLDGNKLQDLSVLCEHLSGSQIIDIDLGDNEINDANLAKLVAVLPKSVLKQLVLGTNPVSPAGVMHLIEILPLSSIEVLYLDHTGADDACLASLSAVLKSTKLCELHLDSTKITDAGVRDFIAHLDASELKAVDVGDNGIRDDIGELLRKRCGSESGPED